MEACQYCLKEFSNRGGLVAHEMACKLNPTPVKRKGGNKKGYVPWNKGKTGVQEAWNKGKEGTFKGKRHSLETKRIMSESKLDAYSKGWESNAGRCKKYDYFSPCAGNIKVDGTWELIFCKALDAANIKWKRNKERFGYIKPDGKFSSYQPDFYVEDWEMFVEVKGYETDLDRIKWSQFHKPLLVVRKNEIGELDEWLKSLPC